MSRRQRSAQERAQRARVAREKALRRRARTRRATTVAVTLAVAGTAGSVVPVSGASPTTAGFAQDPYPYPPCTTPDSDPVDLTDVDGTLFFTADHDRDFGLWRADVTGSTAVRLLDFPYNYGSDGRYDDFGYRGLIDVGGTLFFTTKTDRTDALWRSDGTRDGTVRIKGFADLDSRGRESGPTNMAAVGDTLFFSANGRSGQLWRSDGTKAGTVLVKAIPSGYVDYYYSGPSNLTTVGGTLFFTADDGTGNEELWKSDGTPGGTVLVKDIYPGSDDHDGPRGLTAFGDALYFRADDGVHGVELWKSDGTEAGTVQVEDIVPGPESAIPRAMTVFGGDLYFSARDSADGSRDLWTSDGTDVGTHVVKEFAADDGVGHSGFGLNEIVAVGDEMFFAALDETVGYELWRSDGTEAGTDLVEDLQPGAGDGFPGSLTAVGDTLYFTADDGVTGQDLWRSDGTEPGTVLVEDIPWDSYGQPERLTASGGKLYFEADDGVHGEELWVSDGTASGTHLVRDINRDGISVADRAQTGPRNSTARVGAAFYSAGTVRVAPAGKGGIRRLRQEIVWDGNWYWVGLTLNLELTRTAKRKLRRTGRVEIGARFTFASCAGNITSQTRSYTLKKR